MILYEFNVLDLNNKMDSVNQLGVYLDNYIVEKEKFNLYAIDIFFVEVTYDSKDNKITDINSFKSGHLLHRHSSIENLNL